MSHRVTAFRYRSDVASNGRPRYSLPGIPRRDLAERDIERLSSEQYEEVKAAKQPDGSPLYEPVETKQEPKEPATTKPERGKSA